MLCSVQSSCVQGIDMTNKQQASQGISRISQPSVARRSVSEEIGLHMGVHTN